MQYELDTCKNCPEEATCKELKRELEHLQKVCYHKQIKLQVARQSQNAATTASKTSKLSLTHQQPDFGDDDFPGECENLVEEEWYEAGSLEEFDSDGGMGDDWDLDETELLLEEQSLAVIEPNDNDSNNMTSIGKQEIIPSTKKILPASNFGPARKAGRHSENATFTSHDFQCARKASGPSSGKTLSQNMSSIVNLVDSSPGTSKTISKSSILRGKSSIRMDHKNPR